MAVIKNTVQTDFTSKGAKKVAKDTESIGRAQTRLGQATASSGRQFAAQASGLGGLVAAYAGAAATIFALQAAFSALAKAAQAETVVQGTKALAAEVAQSGPKIISMMQEITQGQLSIAESAQSANIALSAGFNTKQIEGLTKVALGASRALGRNLTDALQRVFRGTAKLEPELLDELGIFVRIEPAVTAYARKLGVAAKSLSQFERRQAFVNAAIEEGTRKFSAIDVNASSTQKSLEQLSTQVIDLATQFGQIVANFLVPFVEFFKDDVGNTLLLFAGIIKLVFSKTGSLIGDFATRSIKNMTTWADNLAETAAKSKGSFEVIRKGAIQLQEDITKRGSLGRFSLKGIQRDLAVEAAQARQRFLSGQPVSQTQIKSDIKTFKDVQKQLTASGQSSNVVFDDANKILGVYEKSIQKAGLRTKILTSFSAALTTTMRGLTKIVSIASKVMNGLFFAVGAAQLIGSIFDVDILGAIKDMFVDLSQAAKEFESGIVGAMSAASGGASVLTRNLIEAGASEEVLKNINKEMVNLAKNTEAATELSLIAESQTLSITKSDPDRLEEVLAIAKSGVIPALEQISFLETEIADKLKRLEGEDNAETIERLKVEIVLRNALLDSLNLFGGSLNNLVGRVSTLTGIDTSSIFETLESLDMVPLNNQLKVFGDLVITAGADGKFSFEQMTEAQQDAFAAGIVGISSLNTLREAYDAGATTVDKMSATIAGSRQQLIEQQKAATEAAAAILDQGGSIDAAEAAYNNYLATLGDVINETVKLRDELKEIENNYKGVTAAFSKDTKILPSLVFEGMVNSSGEFAKNQKEIDANQAEILSSILESAKADNDLLETGRDIEENLTRINANAELYKATLNAIAGRLIGNLQKLEEIRKAEIEKTNELNRQAVILDKQIKLEQTRLDISLEVLRAENAITLAKESLEIETLRLSTDQKRLDILQEQAEAATTLAGLRIEGGDTGTRIEDIAKEVEDLILRIDDDDIRSAASAYKTAIESALIATEANIKQAQIEVINAERDVKEAFINQQIDIFNKETGLLLQEIQNDIDKHKRDIEVIDLQKALDISRFDNEKAALDRETAIVQAQIDGYVQFANVVQGFGDHVQALGGVLSDYISADPRLSGEIREVAVTDIAKQTADAAFIASLAANITNATQTAVIDFQKQALEDLAATQVDIIKEKIATLETQQSNLGATRTEELVQLYLDLESATIGAANEAAILTGTLDDVGNAADKVTAFFDDMQSHFNDALMGLNDLIFYGEGDFREIMSGLFKNIQQDFFQTTIATPISDFLTDSIAKMVGLDRGIDSVKLIKGQVPVIMGADPLGGFGIAEMLAGKTDSDDAGKVIEELLGSDGTMTNAFKGLFGEGGTLSNILGGFGSFASSIFSSLGSFISSLFMAQGGAVHLAQGGGVQHLAAGGASLRDRVPAMLEPGEFVIRKPIAKAVGMPALKSLNATGNMGSGGVEVNISNEGTAQDAQVSAPKFDGTKFVIDIVTKDLANNGPIRRSMRAQ